LERDELNLKLMAYLDGEMDAAERDAFEKEIAADPELGRMTREFGALIDRADALQLQEPPEEGWESYWEEVHDRMGRRFGWVFMALGGLALAGLGLWKYFSCPHHPLANWGLGLGALGAAILFVTVLRERMRELKHDRYRKVRR
jgi:anti-sigma factor RsiW